MYFPVSLGRAFPSFFKEKEKTELDSFIFDFLSVRKRKRPQIYNIKNGERGIRTLGTKKLYNGLAISRFRPLSHLSFLFTLIF